MHGLLTSALGLLLFAFLMPPPVARADTSDLPEEWQDYCDCLPIPQVGFECEFTTGGRPAILGDCAKLRGVSPWTGCRDYTCSTGGSACILIAMGGPDGSPGMDLDCADAPNGEGGAQLIICPNGDVTVWPTPNWDLTWDPSRPDLKPFRADPMLTGLLPIESPPGDDSRYEWYVAQELSLNVDGRELFSLPFDGLVLVRLDPGNVADFATYGFHKRYRSTHRGPMKKARR